MNDIEKLFKHDTDLIMPAVFADDNNEQSSAPQIIPNAEYFEKYLAHCYNTVLTSNDIDINQISGHFGAPQFRQAIATFMFRFHNINVDPEQIIVGSGLQSILSLILQLPSIKHPEGIAKQEGLLSRAEQMATGIRPMVAIAEDEDEQTKTLFSNARIKVKDVTLDEQGISFNSLISSGATLLYITPHDIPNFDNVDLEDRRHDLLNWANEASYRYIIEYDNTKKIMAAPTFKKDDVNDNVIYINSFSSLLCKGISASWAVLPKKLFAEYKQIHEQFPCQLSYLEQMALTLFTDKGYLDNYLQSIQTLIEDEPVDELAF